MTLNRKIVLVLIAGITLYTAVGFAFNHYLILPSFRDLEAQEARKDMRRCLEALEGHITQIALLCADWSAWDDTYEFVDAPTEAYIEANLYPAWFVDNEMDIMYFVRADGGITWGQHFDQATGGPAPFPDFTERLWEPEELLLHHPNRDSVVRGLIRTSLGPMMVVSRPIVPSEAQPGETVRGALIMGRILDDRVLASIRAQTQVALDIVNLDREVIPPEAIGLALDEIRVVPESDSVVRALTHTHDLEGRDTLVFDITIPRLILARGQSAIRFHMLAAGIAGFVFLVMALCAMKWLVSDPLQRLGTHVRSVGLSGGLAPAPLSGRGDEIGEVAREFNGMLERLRTEEAELLAAEAALRASQARLRTILDTAPDGLLILDMEGRIESANHAAARLFAREEAALRGEGAEPLLPPESRITWRAILEAARTNTRAEGELVGTTPEGDIIALHVMASTTELEGRPVYSCALRDISTLKAMQESVARSQHLARIGEMGATVAHEIRNPLAGMKGAIQIMGSGTLDAEENEKVLGEIQVLIDRISGTVEQLLRYAKPIEPRPEPLSLRNMVESVCVAGLITPPTGTTVRYDDVPPLIAFADPRLLRQVLDNIWSNACQAVSPGGAITWSADAREGEVVLRLANDGKPILDADLPHVFEPFFTTRVEGSGLGLSVTQRIIEAHGGSVYIENMGNSGVAVSIRLPQGE